MTIAPRRETAADQRALLATLTEVAATGEFILRSRCTELERRLGDACAGTTVRVAAAPSAALLLVLTALGHGAGDHITAESGSDTVRGVLSRLSVTARCYEPDPSPTVVSDLRRAGGAGDAAAHGHRVVLLDRPPTTPDWAALRATTAVVDLGPASHARGIGAAAAVFTTDARLAERVRMLRNHGQDGVTRFLHHAVGFNSRMDEIAAGYLLATLPWTAP